MNWAHIHLILNHVPVIGIPIGFAVIGWGWGTRSRDVLRLGMLMIAVIGALAIAVYFTGEPAEEVVEGLAGVSEGAIEEHEEAALLATILGGVIALIAAGGLVTFRHREIPAQYTATLLVLTLLTAVILARTANLGGEIRHPEIRGSASVGGTSLEINDE